VEEREERESLTLMLSYQYAFMFALLLLLWYECVEEDGGCGGGSCCLEMSAKHVIHDWVGKPLFPDQGQLSNHTINVYTISTMIVWLNYACE
jgi:hypothetical protein